MLYYFLYPLRDLFFGFNVFKYITFRAAGAAVTAFLLSIIFGPFFISRLKALKIGENVRGDDCPQLYPLHSQKQGTPTMGGIFIIFSIALSVLLWSDLSNKYILLTLFSTLWLGGLGFYDDYKKLKVPKSRGLSIATKMMFQLVLGLIIAVFVYMEPGFSSRLDIPFFKRVVVDLGSFYIAFIIFVIIASSNAVNITDGLDGLAIGNIIMVALTYSALSYVTGHADFSNYLFIPYIKGAGELTVFCASIVGAGLGFLWFNCFPAAVFMGDVGSLALGGAIGTIAVFIKKELLLVLVGGVFVIEVLSVILQVISFRVFGKRIFKIAPLHHHFEKMGWPESKVIVRFWIAASIFALMTLAVLKLR